VIAIPTKINLDYDGYSLDIYRVMYIVIAMQQKMLHLRWTTFQADSAPIAVL
jgi:hypothetical protein